MIQKRSDDETVCPSSWKVDCYGTLFVENHLLCLPPIQLANTFLTSWLVFRTSTGSRQPACLHVWLSFCNSVYQLGALCSQSANRTESKCALVVSCCMSILGKIVYKQLTIRLQIASTLMLFLWDEHRSCCKSGLVQMMNSFFEQQWATSLLVTLVGVESNEKCEVMCW